jgi:thiol-disulfide isomerase/thioredoxin
MPLKIKLSISLFLLVAVGFAQQVSAVYKLKQLQKRIHNNSDTVYVVNFWATWCKPCVQELPEFESFSKKHAAEKIKVLLVCLDFKEELDKKVNPFLMKQQYTMECVLLDETNGNTYINAISKEWTGAIPATLVTAKNKKKQRFAERKLNEEAIWKMVEEVRGE